MSAHLECFLYLVNEFAYLCLEGVVVGELGVQLGAEERAQPAIRLVPTLHLQWDELLMFGIHILRLWNIKGKVNNRAWKTRAIAVSNSYPHHCAL